MQEAVLPEELLFQLHEQWHGVYVVQQHEAVRGLQRLHHLLSLRTVPGVADSHLLASELFWIKNLWTVLGAAWVWLVQ